MRNSPLHFLLPLLALLLLAPPSQAGDYHVSPLGDDVTGDGSEANPWRSITRAMTATVSGDRILVAAGTYDSFSGESFPILVSDGVQVIGPVTGTATVDGENVFVPLFVVLDNLDLTVIQHLRILGPLNLIEVFGNPLDLRVLDCVLQGGRRAINHEANGGPASLLVERCTMLDILEDAVHWQAVAAAGEDHNLVLRDNSMSAAALALHGLFLATAQDATVFLTMERNVISKFTTGMRVQLTAANSNTHVGGLLSGNEIRKSDKTGFELVANVSGTVASSAVFDPELTYNLVTKNGKHGIHASLAATGSGNSAVFLSRLQGNAVTLNGSSGVFLAEQELLGGDCTTQPDLGGGALGSTGANTFALNDDSYASGAEFDLRIEAGEAISAHDNWWGTFFRGLIDRHILDQKDDPLNGLVDVGPLAADPLQFAPAGGAVSGEPGARVVLSAAPGTRFVPRTGSTLLGILVDGTPATLFEVSPGGRTLSFRMPVLPGARAFNAAVQVTNPGGQSGTTELHLTGDSKGGGFCFIATAVYGDAGAPEVRVLREWRDEHLQPTRAGRAFVRYYYRHSPRLALIIERHPWLRTPVRVLLTPVVALVDLWMHARWIYLAAVLLLAYRRLRRWRRKTFPAALAGDGEGIEA